MIQLRTSDAFNLDLSIKTTCTVLIIFEIVVDHYIVLRNVSREPSIFKATVGYPLMLLKG